MKIDPEIIQEIMTAIAPELWWLLVQMLVTVAISLALYKGINSLVSYLYVRLDREIGKNVGVVIDGREGYIAHISLRHVIIRFIENKNELLIPITKVANQSWEVIRRKE